MKSSNQFTKYKSLKDSGVEWLGQIPEHWEVRKLKHIAFANFSSVDKHSIEDELPVYLCNYIDVYHHDFITPDIEFMKATATPEEIRRFSIKEGDVLVTKDSEDWNDIAVPAFIKSEISGVLCGYHLAQIRSNPGMVIGEYLFRAFYARGINDQFRIEATGITRYGLSKYGLDNSLFSVPPLDEQRLIADFLNKETTRIDMLIEKKQKQIELLQEKRTALITQAVTKGLDPNVPMKDSGVEWLGQIPEHWEVKKIKRLCLVKRGASPRPIEDPIYFNDDGEYSWVRISDVTASERYLIQTEQKLSDFGKSKSVALEPGELFLSIAATVGKPIITKIRCCIHDGFVYFVGLKENREYLYYLFNCGEAYKGLGKLGTQLNLNTDTIGDIHISVPSSKEQNAIVDFLDRETAKIDVLKNKIQKGIELLKEYRMVLITAAVTGKIDVRNEMAS
jgi:type I restriction enzyme, S subunit